MDSLDLLDDVLGSCPACGQTYCECSWIDRDAEEGADNSKKVTNNGRED